MKISEILEELTTIQMYANERYMATDAPESSMYNTVARVCSLSRDLAVHVQQLEMDRDKLMNKVMGKVDLTTARQSRFNDKDKDAIYDEVIQAARWYVSLTGNTDTGSTDTENNPSNAPTEEYERLLNSVRVYNQIIGPEEPLKTRP